MQTNPQARVKISPQANTARPDIDCAVVSPSLELDAVAKHSVPIRRQALAGPVPRPTPDLPTDLKPVDHLAATPSFKAMGRGYAFSKRAFDIVVGSAMFMVALPIVLAAALVIRVDSPGSPFFFQTRLGKDGRPFRIFKLRGMYIDARSRFPNYYDYTKKCDLEFCFHHEDDPRVTKAGKFIRKTSIDELPNLWNVVLGDMSLVGPRPEIPEVLCLYGQYRDEYLSVKPGVTCLSKCTGRDRLTKRETIEFDIDYIRRRSFSLDFTILWRTIRAVVLRRDVF
jgi:lipopolysaccharide/colanic/teichoic acid biosynthesis glycosyltransferase